MKVSMSGGVGGAWLDKKALKEGDIMKLVSEAREVPSQQGGVQLVAKAKVKGGDAEAKNVAINTPSKNALIQAFGDDTNDWQDKLLTVHIEKTVIGGKRGTALYLQPEGYSVIEDEGGYLIIAKKDSDTTDIPRDSRYDVDEADQIADSIPF